MTRIISRLSDRLVGRLVPKAVASAAVEWFEPCYCIDGTCLWAGNWCYIVGGTSSCNTGCRSVKPNCCA